MALWPFRRGEEKRSIDSVPWGNGGAGWGAGGPLAAQAMTQERAIRVVPVFGAVRFLADNLAAMAPGLGLYKIGKGDIAVRQPTPALFANPSIHGTLFDWLHKAVISMGFQGDGIGLITQRDYTGLPTMIEWLNPINVQTLDRAIEGPGSYVDPRWYWWGRPMDPKDLLHIPWFCLPWRVRGMSPIEAFAQAAGVALGAQEFAQQWFEQGGVPPGTFRNTTQKVLPDDADEIANRYVRRLRTRKPLVYGMDWEYTAIAIKPNEAQFIETTQMSANQIAVIYGVPPDKLGGSTASGRITYACADDETEILTLRGWLRYDEVTTDDTCLTLNTQTGMSEWQPVEAVNVYRGRHEVIKMENLGHSSVTTTNHRWPVTFGAPPTTRKYKADEAIRNPLSRYERRFAGYNWRTSETLSSDARICAAAPTVTPVEAKWSDALVELVGWFWTEGCITRCDAVTIAQSQAVNPNYCARIRAALIETFGPSGPLRMRTRPSWREDIDDRGRIHFRLNQKAAAVLLPHAPGKVVTVEFLSQLTRAQLELFIETSIAADGWITGISTSAISQRDRPRIDAFQIACALAGRSGSIRRTAAGIWTMCIRKTAWRKPNGHAEAERLTVDGIVWCPTTPNQTWFARRNGTIYATGNSVEQESLDTLTYTFRPWLTRFEYAFSTCFPRGQFVRFSTDEFIRLDAKTRAEIDALSLGTVQTGWKDRDEVRTGYNLPPAEPKTPAASKAPTAPSDQTPPPGGSPTPGTSAGAAEPITRMMRDRVNGHNGHSTVLEGI